MEVLFPYTDLLAHVLSYCVRTTDVQVRKKQERKRAHFGKKKKKKFVCKRFYEVFQKRPHLHVGGRFFYADHVLDVAWGTGSEFSFLVFLLLLTFCQ